VNVSFPEDARCYSLYLEILDVIQKTWNIHVAVNEDAECITSRRSGASFFLQMLDITQLLEVLDVTQTNFYVWVSLMEIPFSIQEKWSTGDAGHYKGSVPR
jgi:hypothetical protein